MGIPALLVLLSVTTADEPWTVVGRLDPAIREASGIAASRRHPGIFWVHNDSGNPPELFAVRRDGSLVRKYRVGVPNVDWEDIHVDDDGHLYIGDTGNNGQRLALRMIYRLDEPDPNEPADDDKPLPVTRAWFYRFADRESRFDAESLFQLDGRFVVIAKYRDGKPADWYAIPIEPPATLTKPAIPQRVGTLPGAVEAVTSASYDDRRGRLAVLSGKHVRIYRKTEREEWVEPAVVDHGMSGAEGITWDGEDLLIVVEDRRIARIEQRTWKSRERAR